MPRALVVVDVQIGIVAGPPPLFEPDRLLGNVGVLVAFSLGSHPCVVNPPLVVA